MKNKFQILVFAQIVMWLFFGLFLLFLSCMVTDVFAEKTYEIKIPSGAADPNAPYFWSEKSTGVTTGEITIFPGDSITWENADTAFHSITSVTRDGVVDGLFDSGLFTAGKSYTLKFDELGDFYYFCSIHPWMNGVVHVIKNPGSVQTIHNVGSGLSETGVGYEIKYILDTSLSNTVDIDSMENTITVKISGISQNEQITLILPTQIIENPNAVWVDSKKTEFEIESTQSGNKLIIPISENSNEIKIMGTRVIPEFGILALGVLSASIITVIMFSRSKLGMF